MTIGQYLRDVRKEQVLTLRPVADAAGISVVYLHDIEKGRRIPPIETVERIASALNLDVSCIAEQHHRERLQQSESGRALLQRLEAAEATGRAAVRAAHAIVEQADPQLHWGDPTSYAEIKWRLIDELRAMLATDTAQAWLVDSSEL